MSSSEGISRVIRVISTPTSALSIDRRPRPMSVLAIVATSSSHIRRGNNTNICTYFGGLRAGALRAVARSGIVGYIHGRMPG